MAVWGYCRLCEKLVPIEAKGFKHDGSREKWWHPREHDDPDGKRCEGVKRGI